MKTCISSIMRSFDHILVAVPSSYAQDIVVLSGSSPYQALHEVNDKKQTCRLLHQSFSQMHVIHVSIASDQGTLVPAIRNRAALTDSYGGDEGLDYIRWS